MENRDLKDPQIDDIESLNHYNSGQDVVPIVVGQIYAPLARDTSANIDYLTYAALYFL